MSDLRFSDNDVSKRDIPSFIEPRPPLILNPFMRPRPQRGINLLEQFEEDSELEEPEVVQVYLRLKPCNVPNTLYEVRGEKCLVTSLDTATAGHGRRTQHNVSKMYTFSKIFGPECNQKEIFEAVVKDNLKKLPDGHNFTLLTYGASGSGKTFTLMGTVASPGLVPRSLEYVFRLVDAAQQPAYKPAENGADKLNYTEQDNELQWVKRLRHVSAPLRDKYRRMSTQLHSDLTISSIDLSNRIKHYVWVSFVEIYNEAIYDLLAPPEKRTKLRIREDTGGNVYVKGATQAFVRSGEEAYDVMVAGKHNLVVAATGVHAHSSRSHCIFTITMLTETGDGSVRTSYVRLCDLAGCERARATRNTGARMAESRAINSSLHVLERCLHMLRRKQRSAKNDTMVPYRESKLTRLLGTGLSGARGEAVSMVVTLNPSPQYAHETKHVLSLAAVAQDIQINNTMLVSTLESTTVDTTVSCSSEVMQLRSDNERLHFELVQAQSRNKELLAAMEEKQQESADTMRELVEEAKDMTKQYYEEQLEALRAKMDEMVEEYESRLSKVAAPSSGAGTPSRYFQAKVAQLMAEIAILDEKLTAEKLARARAEKEVQHLRTCIEERDEKADTSSHEDAMSPSDSENEDDVETNDPFNESLEPLFKKELNRRSLALQHGKQHETASIQTVDNIEEEEDNDTSDLEKSVTNNTLTEDFNNSTYATENDLSNKIDAMSNSIDMSSRIEDSIDSAKNMTKELTYEESNTTNVTYHEDKDLSLDNDVHFRNESFKSGIGFRETYFVRDEKANMNDNEEQTATVKKTNSFRGTYCVNEPKKENRDKTLEEIIIPEFKAPLTTQKITIDKEIPRKTPEKLVNKIIKSIKTSQSSDSSLRQFEQLEMAANECDDDVPENQYLFGGIKLLKEKRTYFNNNSPLDKVPKYKPDELPIVVNKEKRTYFDNAGVTVEVSDNRINVVKHIDDERSPSIVKDIVSDNFEPTTIKKLLGENLAKSDVISLIHNSKLNKKHDSVDIFEGYDSPLMPKSKEIIPSPGMLKATEDVITQETLQLKENILIPVTSKLKETTEDNNEFRPKDPILDNIEFARKSIEQLVLNQSAKKAKQVDYVSPIEEEKELKIEPVEIKNELKLEAMSSVEESIDLIKETNMETGSSLDEPRKNKLDATLSIDEPNQSIPINDTKVDNTIEEFENIYKDITAPRATDFELLVTQEMNETNSTENIEKESINNIDDKNVKQSNKIESDQDKEGAKYNLRKKPSKLDTLKAEKSNGEEISAEPEDKSDSKPRKRALRLRRRKNQEEEGDEKLKDIVNLQREFSDVTLDVPAPQNYVKDIPSPEKGEEENLPPLLGIQSCPSKSVTRSRRKLFTPRAEPLEESPTMTGDSNERIYIPRPSYHRPRARRKL